MEEMEDLIDKAVLVASTPTAQSFSLDMLINGPIQVVVELSQSMTNVEGLEKVKSSLEVSGLKQTIDHLASLIIDDDIRGFSTDQYVNAFKCIDAFWRTYYECHDVPNNLHFDCAITAKAVEDCDWHSMNKLGLSLTQAIQVPASSVEEWRRNMYIRKVGTMLQLVGGSVEILQKSYLDSSRLNAEIRRKDIMKSVELGESLARNNNKPIKVKTEDLIDLYLMYRLFYRRINRLELLAAKAG